MHAQLLSHVSLFVTPWTAAHQAPLSVGFLQARMLGWVAVPFFRGSSQPRIEPISPVVPALAGRFFIMAPFEKAQVLFIIIQINVTKTAAQGANETLSPQHQGRR